MRKPSRSSRTSSRTPPDIPSSRISSASWRQPTRRSATSRRRREDRRSRASLPGSAGRPPEAGTREPVGHGRPARPRANLVRPGEPAGEGRRPARRPGLGTPGRRSAESAGGDGPPREGSTSAPSAGHQGMLAALLRKVKQPDEALSVYRQAAQSIETLAPENPEDLLEPGPLACGHRQPCRLAWRGHPERGGQSPRGEGGRPRAGQPCQGGRRGLQRSRHASRCSPTSTACADEPISRRWQEEIEKRHKVLVWNQDYEAAKAQALEGEEGPLPLLRRLGLVPVRSRHAEVAAFQGRIPGLCPPPFRDRGVRQPATESQARQLSDSR